MQQYVERGLRKKHVTQSEYLNVRPVKCFYREETLERPVYTVSRDHRRHVNRAGVGQVHAQS